MVFVYFFLLKTILIYTSLLYAYMIKYALIHFLSIGIDDNYKKINIGGVERRVFAILNSSDTFHK